METPPEPGLDIHEWTSAWASIEEEQDSDPAAALSQLADLAHRMLLGSGYDVDDPVAREGDEQELVASYLAARETAERAELGAASRSEVEQATEDLRAVFETLSGESRRASSGT